MVLWFAQAGSSRAFVVPMFGTLSRIQDFVKTKGPALKISCELKDFLCAQGFHEILLWYPSSN
jgi:hypothetical protein